MTNGPNWTGVKRRRNDEIRITRRILRHSLCHLSIRASFVIPASSFFLIAIPLAAVRHSFLSPANSRSESPSPRSVGARPFFCAALAPVPIRPGDRADLRAWSPFGAVESRDTAVSPPTHDRDATPCSLFL